MRETSMRESVRECGYDENSVHVHDMYMHMYSCMCVPSGFVLCTDNTKKSCC